MRAIEAATMNVRLITGNTRWLMLDHRASMSPRRTLSTTYRPVRRGGGVTSMSRRPVGVGAMPSR